MALELRGDKYGMMTLVWYALASLYPLDLPHAATWTFVQLVIPSVKLGMLTPHKHIVPIRVCSHSLPG
jgi:hypothetical protein